MKTEIFSWALAAVGITGVWITGNKSRWGWLLGVIYQLAWIVYAYLTRQYSFIVVCVVYTFVYVKNFLEWGGASERSQP